MGEVGGASAMARRPPALFCRRPAGQRVLVKARASILILCIMRSITLPSKTPRIYIYIVYGNRASSPQSMTLQEIASGLLRGPGLHMHSFCLHQLAIRSHAQVLVAPINWRFHLMIPMVWH
jgi:hypothetical protein